MNPITEKFCPKCKISFGLIANTDPQANKLCAECKQATLLPTDGPKYCNQCFMTKHRDKFHKNKKTSDGLQSRCKECNKANFAASYKKDPEINTKAVKRRRIRNVKINKQRVWDYLLKHPCLHCGEDDPIVLEFDHIDPSTKISAIAMLRGSNCSWAKLEAEIAKCQVLCANCHRRKTAKELGHHKDFVDWDSTPGST